MFLLSLMADGFGWISDHATILATVVAAIAAVWVARFTAVLARVTGEQARLTNEGIKLARDEFNATHRPKIFVQAVAVTDKGSRTVLKGYGIHNPAKAIITIANGGDAPAFIIEWRAVIYYQGADAAFTPGLDVAPVQLPDENAAGISPGVFEHLGHSQVHAISDEWARFVNEGGAMFFIGRITYQGADRIRRNTGFCRRYDPEDTGAWRIVKDSEYEFAY